MKGKDIINHAIRTEMPDMEHMKENCIRQAQNHGRTKRNIWVKRTATVAVCFALVFSMMFALPWVWNNGDGGNISVPPVCDTQLSTSSEQSTSRPYQPPNPPVLSFPNITPLTVRASSLVPDSTIGGTTRPGAHFQWEGGFSRFSLSTRMFFDTPFWETFNSGEWNDTRWYIWIRVFDENTMMPGTENGGGWQQIHLSSPGQVRSTQHVGWFSDAARHLGFELEFCWFTIAFHDGINWRNYKWNYDAFDFQLGVRYEYMISATVNGENRFTSYSETFDICEMQIEAITLFRELYEATGLLWAIYATPALINGKPGSTREGYELHREIYDARVAFVTENLHRFLEIDERFEFLINGDIQSIFTPCLSRYHSFGYWHEYLIMNALFVDGEMYALGWFYRRGVDQIIERNFCDDVLLNYWAHLEYRVANNLLDRRFLDGTALEQVVQNIKANR